MLERLYTAQDLEGLDDDYELDEGRLIPRDPPSAQTWARLCPPDCPAANHCEATGQGEVLCNDTGFMLERDPDTLRGPDIAVILAERLKDQPEDGWPEGAADLVVEVFSPGDSPGRLQRKVGQYLDAGASLVWVAYPQRIMVAVYDKSGSIQLRSADQELSGDSVLPGFRCVVRDLL